MMRHFVWRLARLAAPILASLSVACDEGGPLRLPSPAAAAAEYGEGVEAELSGNLLEVRVPISQELLRGGSIWKRSGPYFYLFSTDTRDLFVEYPDLAAVRVIATDPAGDELARATLLRDEFSEFEWEEAIARAAIAQQQGTESPRQIEELIFFGEDHTEFRYANEDAGT